MSSKTFIYRSKEKEDIDSKGNYQLYHVRNWLISHKALKISKIEILCDMPKGTLRHFIRKSRNTIPKKYEQSLYELLEDYGYTPLND